MEFDLKVYGEVDSLYFFFGVLAQKNGGFLSVWVYGFWISLRRRVFFAVCWFSVSDIQ